MWCEKAESRDFQCSCDCGFCESSRKFSIRLAWKMKLRKQMQLEIFCHELQDLGIKLTLEKSLEFECFDCRMDLAFFASRLN
jgi:hypothetical protein